MKIVRDLDADFVIDGPVVFCIGVFDGVHIGHQHLIKKAKQLRPKCGHTVLFSLTDAPKFSSSAQRTKRICTLAHKEKLLSQLEIDVLVHIPFTDELKNLTPQKFLEYLNAKMNILHYVVCDDVSFGCNRSGNLEYLVKEANFRGQTVHCCEKLRDVSSTSVRGAIQACAFDQASLMLGRPYSIYGSFTKSHQGFLYLEDASLLLPPSGVYNSSIGMGKALELFPINSLYLGALKPWDSTIAKGLHTSSIGTVPINESVRDFLSPNETNLWERSLEQTQVTICDNQLRLPSHLMHTYEGEGVLEIVFST